MKIDKFSLAPLKQANNILSEYFSEYYINKQGVVHGLSGIKFPRVCAYLGEKFPKMFNDIYVQPKALKTFINHVKISETQIINTEEFIKFEPIDTSTKSLFLLPRSGCTALNIISIYDDRQEVVDIFNSSDIYCYKLLDHTSIDLILDKQFIDLDNGLKSVSKQLLPSLDKALSVEYHTIPFTVTEPTGEVIELAYCVFRIRYPELTVIEIVKFN